MKERIFDLGEEWFIKLLDYLPTIALALFILIAGMILANLLSKATRRLTKFLRLDKLFDRLNSISILSSNNIQIKPGIIFGKFIYYLVWLVALILVIDILNIDSLNAMILEFFAFIPQILAAVFILIFGLLICDFLRKSIYTAASSLNIPSARLIASIIFYFGLINVAMLSLKQIKIETTFLEQNITVILAGLVFAFALGYGLSTRYKIENYFYQKDVMRHLSLGSKITLGQYTGTVQRISNNYVHLVQEEGREIAIPLKEFKQQTFTVHS